MWICDLCCLAICIYLYSTLHSLQITIGSFNNCCYIYFVLNSAQSSGKKIIGNVTVQNYLKESLLCILCFIIQGKGSSGKGLILQFILLCMTIRHDRVSCLLARNEIRSFCPLKANILFVSIIFLMEMVAFMNSSCCVTFELKKFPYMS